MVSKAQKRAAALAKAQAGVSASQPPVANPVVTETKVTPLATAEQPKVVTKVVGNLQVKDGLQFRGARQAWYDVLKAHNGKPAQEYLEATAKTPPSLPKSGRAEAPSGWLRWFVRHGHAVIVQPPKAE